MRVSVCVWVGVCACVCGCCRVVVRFFMMLVDAEMVDFWVLYSFSLFLPSPSSFLLAVLLHLASAATLINIRNARKHFEKLERVDGPKHSLHMRMR